MTDDQEPFYVRQTGEPKTQDERDAWFRACLDESVAEGGTFHRVSYHPDMPDLLLVEGWKKMPKDQGELRFALAARPASKQEG